VDYEGSCDILTSLSHVRISELPCTWYIAQLWPDNLASVPNVVGTPKPRWRMDHAASVNYFTSILLNSWSSYGRRHRMRVWEGWINVNYIWQSRHCGTRKSVMFQNGSESTAVILTHEVFKMATLNSTVFLRSPGFASSVKNYHEQEDGLLAIFGMLLTEIKESTLKKLTWSAFKIHIPPLRELSRLRYKWNMLMLSVFILRII
jgi:hypothetical protein